MTRRTLGLGFDQATLFEMPFLPSFFMEMTRMNAWRCATARPPAWAFVINFTRISCTITLLADTVGTIFVAAEVARVTFSVHVAWFDFHLSVFDWIVGERKVISESNWVLATCNGMWGSSIFSVIEQIITHFTAWPKHPLHFSAPPTKCQVHIANLQHLDSSHFLLVDAGRMCVMSQSSSSPSDEDSSQSDECEAEDSDCFPRLVSDWYSAEVATEEVGVFRFDDSFLFADFGRSFSLPSAWLMFWVEGGFSLLFGCCSGSALGLLQ